MDINNNTTDLVRNDDGLNKKHLQIIINEKINLLKQLEVRLDHIMTVEVKQIELKMDVLKKEVEAIQRELDNKSNIIDVKGEIING